MKNTFGNFQEGKMTYSNGVLHVEYNKDAVINETVLLKQIICRKNLTGDDNFYCIVDLRNVGEVTDEAVELAASNPSPERVKAIAMITEPGTLHTRAKLYSVFDRPNILSKAFLNIEEAMLWFEVLENDGFIGMKKAG